MSTGEPAQTPVERVTEKKAKDPKVAAGRAGAATQRTAQKRLLEQLQAAKESFHPGDGTAASIPPKVADSKYRERRYERPEQSD